MELITCAYNRSVASVWKVKNLDYIGNSSIVIQRFKSGSIILGITLTHNAYGILGIESILSRELRAYPDERNRYRNAREKDKILSGEQWQRIKVRLGIEL